MDAVIIVGIISAFVSVLSLLGNIYISRQNTKSSERIIGLETLSSIQKEQRQAFNDFEKEAELLRIRCWGLKGLTDNYGKPDLIFSITVYNDSVKSLLDQGENLRVRWASIKAELPSEVESYTRKIWHDCNNKMDGIELISRSLATDIERDRYEPSQDNLPTSLIKRFLHDFEAVSRALASLLTSLDELISISKSIRRTTEARYRDFKI